jgi:hypothetical protein
VLPRGVPPTRSRDLAAQPPCPHHSLRSQWGQGGKTVTDRQTENTRLRRALDAQIAVYLKLSPDLSTCGDDAYHSPTDFGLYFTSVQAILWYADAGDRILRVSVASTAG